MIFVILSMLACLVVQIYRIRGDIECSKRAAKSSCNYYEDSTCTDMIKVEQLRELYIINPKRFGLDSYYVLFKHGNTRVYIYFSSISEYLRYVIWKAKIKEKEQLQKETKQQERDNKILSSMYESLLKDIEEQKKKADLEMRQASDRIAEISERLMKEKM